MITWMQRHKKYLIITIWISTIAFVGAGFVGWGQYSYGDKAGAVAKVGEIEISRGDLQKTYSNLYNQYNQVFQGNFDAEKAKSFGLEQQALKQLLDQALLLNLALSYNLEVNDDELLDEIKTQDYFFKDGAFDKEIYKQVLSKNNMSIQDYEASLKKQLLVNKILKLLKVTSSENENNILNTALNIADKINYKVLSDSQISIDTSDAKVKPYWETIKQNFMSEVSYDVKFIKQAKVDASYDDTKLQEYYTENKTHFRAEDGKILAFENAKDAIKKELDLKAAKNLSSRTYIANKKGKLANDIVVKTATISSSNNPFNSEVIEKISATSLAAPHVKPILVDEEYITFELVKINPSVSKTYEQAKTEVLPLYLQEEKKAKLLELAKNSVATFNGKTTDFLTSMDAAKLSALNFSEANEFLLKLLNTKQKRGFVMLGNSKVVLYNILEQKLLSKANNDNTNTIVKIKGAMFNEGLLKDLNKRYTTEIFIQGS